MKRLEIVTYTYKQRLDEDDLRALTKAFVERGANAGVVAHYERLDGRGGILVQEPNSENLEDDYERTLAYSKFVDFEIIPVAPMDDAIGTILKLYG